MEERDDIIVMLDENGEEEEFEYLDSVELDGKEYVVLLPLDEDEEIDDEDLEDEDYEDIDEDDLDDDDEVVILRVEHENGEEVYVNIESDDELDEVFEVFKAKMDEEYGIE